MKQSKLTWLDWLGLIAFLAIWGPLWAWLRRNYRPRA